MSVCVRARVPHYTFHFRESFRMPYRLKVTLTLLLKNILTFSYFFKVQFNYKIMKRSTQRDSSFHYYYTCASCNIMK